MNSNHFNVSSTATSITVLWNKQHVEDNVVSEKILQYDIKYRKSGEKLTNFQVPNDGESEITGLISDTSYEINVYSCGDSGDVIRLFTTRCKTRKSNALFLMENARADKSKKPIVYHLSPVNIAEHTVEVKTENNQECLQNEDGTYVVDRFRICDMISEYKPGIETSKEKTLLLLGATGTGKSTFVEALFNYIANVSFNDEHRFALINKTDEEKERGDKLTQSQTTSVTVYRIPKVDGFQFDYQINIIDTPGFNDTRENYDKRIIEQIKELFENKITHLDAILVVIPLSITRLTDAQQDVFSKITRMFGEDIANNILIAITWDDGGEETCLAVLRDAKIPINDTFRFNNASVLVKYPQNASPIESADKTGGISNVKVKKSREMTDKTVEKTKGISNDQIENSQAKESLHTLHMEFWDRRNRSFSMLFKKLEKIQRTTVKSSIEVMRARVNLEIRLASLKNQITEQSQVIANYIKDQGILVKLEHETPENKKQALYSEFEIEMQRQFYGKSSLNCRKCRNTCHRNCWVPTNLFKRTCEAIEKKKCTVCEGRCGLNEHSLEKYVYEPKYVTKLYSCEDVVNRQTKREIAFSRFKKLLVETADLIALLHNIALEKNVLTLTMYIQDLISKENENENPDFQLRIQLLEKLCDYLKSNDSLRNISMACLS